MFSFISRLFLLFFSRELWKNCLRVNQILPSCLAPPPLPTSFFCFVSRHSTLLLLRLGGWIFLLSTKDWIPVAFNPFFFLCSSAFAWLGVCPPFPPLPWCWGCAPPSPPATSATTPPGLPWGVARACSSSSTPPRGLCSENCPCTPALSGTPSVAGS